MGSHLVIVDGLLAGFLLISRILSRLRPDRRLPPGPKGIPVLGNIFDFPPPGVPEFEHWLHHKDTYGPISSVTVLGQTAVIIHDVEAARHILDKESKFTSGRPRLEFAQDLCGFGKSLASMQNNHTLREHRRIVHQQIGTPARAAHYDDMLEMEIRRFLLQLLQSPENITEQIMTAMSAIILRMTYGYSIRTSQPDPLVTLIERMMSNFSMASVPMTWLVDIIPAIKLLPSWLPGMSFKEKARVWNNVTHAATEIPYAFVKKQLAGKRHQPSYVASLLERPNGGQKQEPPDEEAIKWTAATLYGAGADTTSGTLSFFILAMVNFPEVQRKAQEELDRVIGPGKLPRLADRGKLAYIEAVLKEAHRWCPVGPMGFAHMSDQDIF
ncbi:hypothetical protein HIM_04964 [Hirsutella minnesotensis 3608]|uniref:O-methylsterigmatocystin oxidoreductase n=1 Tax=Hirsutella minnesotensis 3608 TaxID=1043627 RepID=A0A0F8A126_9HYPO|nr:hypothetical protein HIM_04964 [Hirsutella minnesotensis 3608]